MGWRTCKALDEYRDAVNKRFPNRSKHSDGTIGDSTHAGQGRDSDHNPWVVNAGIGVVRAFDLTHDPANGVDCEKLSDYLFEMGKAGDKRLRNGGYIIFNNWITNADWGAWRKYDGSNPHTSHMHISFSTDRYDDSGDWSQAFGPVKVAPQPKVPGMTDDERKLLQDLLFIAGDIREQLCGQGCRAPGQYTGWPQLNGKTFVDALSEFVSKVKNV